MFELTDDQALLRETSVRFIETELPMARARTLHEDPGGLDRGVLRKGAELGWFAMLVPEQLGGGSVSGTGIADAAVIAEVHGRTVQPGPLVPMNVVARAIATRGSARLHAEVLRGLVNGELLAVWAIFGAQGDLDAGAGLQARRVESGVMLDGARSFVQDGIAADVVLTTAFLDGELVQVLVPTSSGGLTRRSLKGLDLSRRFAHFDFAGVVVPDDAVLSGGASDLDADLDVAIVLNLSETVGAMDALFDMTITYAKDRVAFGRPIGSFQAIKHVLADQALYLETSKAAVEAAMAAVANRAADASELVCMAAAYVGEHGNQLAQECLQVHGGIGYTWEHDLHLFLRRIQSNTALYGEPTWHRERLCALHGLGGAG